MITVPGDKVIGLIGLTTLEHGVGVALANKLAKMAWAVLARGEA